MADKNLHLETAADATSLELKVSKQCLPADRRLMQLLFVVSAAVATASVATALPGSGLVR